MGAIYETIQDIPLPGEHEAVAARLLDGLGAELQPGEGVLVVGSFANDAWDARSDLDFFAHTSVSRKRVMVLREMAAALVADSHVDLEFQAIYTGGPKFRQEGDYQNHVRTSPRWNRSGMLLLRGADPNLVLGEGVQPTTPELVYGPFKGRLKKLESLWLEDKGPSATNRKEARKGLELPDKLSLSLLELQAFGYDTAGLEEVAQDDTYRRLLALDADLAAVTRAAQNNDMRADEYGRIAESFVQPAARLGWRLLGRAAAAFSQAIRDNSDTSPREVTTDELRTVREAWFAEIRQRRAIES